MMGKGGEWRYGVEESYIYLPNIKMSPESPSVLRPPERQARNTQFRSGMDVYTQVLKSLAVKPVFGVDEAGPSGSHNSSLGHPSLRSLNQTENKRKHRPKPTQVLGGTNRKYTPYCGNGDPCGSQFWLQLEDYFREVTSEDIQLLLPQTSSNPQSDEIDPCFLMPAVGPYHRKSWSEEIAEDDVNVSKVVAKPSITRVKRKLLAAGPVNKKKKISSSVPDAIVTVISPPENDDDELCHVCHSGDCDEHNKILYCDSCNAAVHQECYGVTVVPEGRWLCSWCFHRFSTSSRSPTKNTLYQSPSGESDFPPPVLLPDCVLCPVKGGAVKPVVGVDSVSGSGTLQIMKFAHLFCCQWFPETYIHDMETMEPIKNVEGVREEHWRLLCCVCRDKHGACIQCSHGMCAFAFHPLCAREAKLRMEVSSKESSDDIELRAFCSKHSACNGRNTVSGSVQILNGGRMTEVKTSVCVSDDAAQGGDPSSVSKERTQIKERPTMDSIAKGDNYESAGISKGRFDEDKLFDREASEDLTVEPICTAGSGSSSSKATGFMDETDKNCKIWETKRHMNEGHDQIDSGLVYHANAIDTPLPQKGLLPNSRKLALGVNTNITVPEPKNTLHVRETLLDQERLDNAETACLLSSGNSQLVAADINNINHLANSVSSMLMVDGSTPCETRFGNNKVERGVSAKPVIEQFCPVEVTSCIVSHQEAPSTLEVCENSSPERDKTLCGNEAPQSFVHPYILKRLREVQDGQATDQAVYVEFQQMGQEEVQEGQATDQAIYVELEHIGQDAVRKEPVSSDLPTQLSHASVLAKDQQQSSRYKVTQAALSIYRSDCYLRSLKERTCNQLDAQWKQLQEAKSSGVLDMVVLDELEEEILGLQNSLIACAHANRHSCEQLISKVIRSLPDELRASQTQQQNWMLVNQYLNEAREAKKQGRKERRNKEAQAVLAAAAAAVAASPRLGGTRRDALGVSFVEDSLFSVRENPPLLSSAGRIPNSVSTAYSLANTGLPSDTSNFYLGKPPMAKPLKVNIAAGRPTSSRTTFHAKGAVSKPTDGRYPIMKSNSHHPVDLKEESTLCDICSGQDVSTTNRIVCCQQCKVAVHQDCYGVSRLPGGAWYCQPCCEVPPRECEGLVPLETDNRGKLGLSVQCALCCKQSGAFKRSTDGQWVHVFCAQWMPELKVGKDQTASIEGLEALLPERFSSLCGVCRQQQGASLRCNFGHCHAAFHPLCAREAGFYMNVRPNLGNRAQYRAYCEKHSPQQRVKAETRKCGPDELNALKQIRVELERVRLICERISRRERLKRDLLNCSRDLYTCRLTALSASLHASDPQPENVTHIGTSLKIDNGQKSYYQEMPWVADKLPKDYLVGRAQRSDSESHHYHGGAIEVNRCQQSLHGNFDNQSQFTSQQYEPSRPVQADSQTGRNLAGVYSIGKQVNEMSDACMREEDQKRLKIRKAEPLHREVVMTPTEASVQNQRLPKGYAYVPVVLLSKGKVAPPESAQDS